MRSGFLAILAAIAGSLWAMTLFLYLKGCPDPQPGDVMSALHAYQHENALASSLIGSVLTTVLIPYTWFVERNTRA